MSSRSEGRLTLGDDGNVVNETTPLLNAPESTGGSSQSNGTLDSRQANGHVNPKPAESTAQDGTQDEEEKKMPYVQILILCYASLGEPVAFFAIFPFVNEMIAVNGHLIEKDVGFYSGLIESLFSLTQMLLMIIYGRAADRLGRKPVLVFSLTGVGFATALFGMSKTVWQMIVTRCLAGVFAGSVVTIRTMLSENTTKETQGKAFSWYMFTRNLGIFLGPIVGIFRPVSDIIKLITLTHIIQAAPSQIQPNSSHPCLVELSCGTTTPTRFHATLQAVSFSLLLCSPSSS